MTRRPFAAPSRLKFETLEPRRFLAADILISEFLASNVGGLRDGDGDSSDWIELYNPATTPVDVGGYHLTDDAADLAKWTFPNGTSIPGQGTLIVFASDKTDAAPPDEFHANFKLSSDGEFLALIAPDGVEVVQEFAPSFPPQSTNVSYGASMASSSVVLVDDQSTMRYLIPSNASVDGSWQSRTFNDAAWNLGTAGLGYENNPGREPSYESLLDAVVPSGTTTAYARFAFDVDDPSAVDSLLLGMLYDDGFVAY
ncbi:MAG: lamin tail domain-containing protein, partial [Planctomycetales bacterium]|nr:lamin tail domain-containing protein [Planctomycetales bacterium]